MKQNEPVFLEASRDTTVTLGVVNDRAEITNEGRGVVKIEDRDGTPMTTLGRHETAVFSVELDPDEKIPWQS